MKKKLIASLKQHENWVIDTYDSVNRAYLFLKALQDESDYVWRAGQKPAAYYGGGRYIFMYSNELAETDDMTPADELFVNKSDSLDEYIKEKDKSLYFHGISYIKLNEPDIEIQIKVGDEWKKDDSKWINLEAEYRIIHKLNEAAEDPDIIKALREFAEFREYKKKQR